MQAVIAGEIADFMKFSRQRRPTAFDLDTMLTQVAAPHT
jgi:hypothetical protein